MSIFIWQGYVEDNISQLSRSKLLRELLMNVPRSTLTSFADRGSVSRSLDKLKTHPKDGALIWQQIKDDYRTLIGVDWLFDDVKKPTLKDLEDEYRGNFGKKF